MSGGILATILARKAEAVAAARRALPLSEIEHLARAAEPPLDFAAALHHPPQDGRAAPVSVIAEVKKASPSRGVIRPDFDPVAIARDYAAAGASAISVLTDEPFFQGHLDYLRQIRVAVTLPLLRKDFVIDPYQVYEARAAGADAVLLIVAALHEAGRLRELRELAESLGLAVLVEVHTAAELAVAAASGARIIGINNRDLTTFHTSLQVSVDLAPQVPPGALLVSESGIGAAGDLVRLHAAGAHAVLVGESLMRQAAVAGALRALLGVGAGMPAEKGI